MNIALKPETDANAILYADQENIISCQIAAKSRIVSNSNNSYSGAIDVLLYAKGENPITCSEDYQMIYQKEAADGTL